MLDRWGGVALVEGVHDDGVMQVKRQMLKSASPLNCPSSRVDTLLFMVRREGD